MKRLGMFCEASEDFGYPLIEPRDASGRHAPYRINLKNVLLKAAAHWPA